MSGGSGWACRMWELCAVMTGCGTWFSVPGRAGSEEWPSSLCVCGGGGVAID